MTDRVLYTVALPEDPLTQQSRGSESAVQQMETVNADFGSSIQTGSQPSQSPLKGQMRGKYADGMALEVGEIASNSDIKEVVLRGKNADIPQAGYYNVRSGGINEVDPRSSNLQEYNVDLDQVGTRRSHYRAIECAVVDVDNPYGGGSANAYVAIPNDASNVRWYDPKNNAVEGATVSASRSGEYEGVEVYDAYSDPSFSGNPHLVYDVPYDSEGWTDPRVYDDRNGSKFDNGNRAWDRVFVSKHDFKGRTVVSNGMVRATFDEGNSNIDYEEYSSGSWSSVSLNAANHDFREIVINAIGQTKVEAQLIFQYGDYYHLNMSLRRYNNGGFMFTVPDDEAAIPTDLEDKLRPMASGECDYDAQPTQTLKPRREVMK